MLQKSGNHHRKDEQKKAYEFHVTNCEPQLVQECSINSMFAIDLHFVVLHDIHK